MLALEAGETGPDGAAVYNGGVMKLTNLEKLHSARAARTYPVGAETLARAIEAAIRDLSRWELARSSEEEIRAVRRTRLGFGDDITVRLVPLESGDHTNTHAKIESRSHVSL